MKSDQSEILGILYASGSNLRYLDLSERNDFHLKDATVGIHDISVQGEEVFFGGNLGVIETLFSGYKSAVTYIRLERHCVAGDLSLVQERAKSSNYYKQIAEEVAEMDRLYLDVEQDGVILSPVDQELGRTMYYDEGFVKSLVNASGTMLSAGNYGLALVLEKKLAFSRREIKRRIGGNETADSGLAALLSDSNGQLLGITLYCDVEKQEGKNYSTYLINSCFKLFEINKRGSDYTPGRVLADLGNERTVELSYPPVISTRSYNACIIPWPNQDRPFSVLGFVVDNNFSYLPSKAALKQPIQLNGQPISGKVRVKRYLEGGPVQLTQIKPLKLDGELLEVICGGMNITHLTKVTINLNSGQILSSNSLFNFTTRGITAIEPVRDLSLHKRLVRLGSN